MSTPVTSSGSPLGPTMPRQAPMFQATPTVSCVVGTSGKAGLRSLDITASDFTRPASSSERASGMEAGHDVDAAGDQVLQAGSGAFARHPRHGSGIDPELRKQAGYGEMPDAALAGAGGLELAGISLDRPR